MTAPDRRRLFAAAIAVILLAAVGFALIERPGSDGERRSSAASPAGERSVSTAEAPADVDAVRPSEEGRSRAAVESPEDVRAPRDATSRFLDAYLPYTYGRRSAGSIPAASDALRRRLVAQRPRVPARERNRRPRVELIHGDGVGYERAGMLALIGDGARRYTLSLELVRVRSGWQVVDVGS